MWKVAWLCPFPVNALSEELGLDKRLNRHAGSWLVNLASELSAKKDIELHIISGSAHVNHDVSCVKNNIHFHFVRYSFPLANRGFPSYLPLDAITGYRILRIRCGKLIDGIRPDIIHAHGTEKGYGLIANSITGCPSLISMQGIMNEIYPHEKNLYTLLQKRIELRSVKEGRNFGCRTGFDSNFVRYHNPLARIHYCPEAVNPVFFKTGWTGDSSQSEITFTGTVCKRKGIEDLISALHTLKEKKMIFSLNVVGDGEKSYLSGIRKLIEKYHLDDRIRFYGTLDPESISIILARSAFFVLPSHIDNSPNSLAEAMAAGVPSIASNAGGMPSMIEDREDGLLFRAGDVRDLCEKIALLTTHPDLRQKISVNARNKAIKRNFPPVVASIMMDVYKDIINPR